MNWIEHTDTINSLYRHMAGQTYQLLEERKREVSSINTLAGWQERQDHIRETLLGIIGHFPERTDLNAKVTGIIKKDGSRVERKIFESRSGFNVTGSLFISDVAENKKLPAILYCSGHTVIAYGAVSGTYQNLVINLARKGFVFFAFDPEGHGERLEYSDPEDDRSLVGSSTIEHSYPGAQAFIQSTMAGALRTYDLQNLAASVAPRKLMMLNVQDAAATSKCMEEIDKDLSVIDNAVNRNNASGSLKIFSGNDLADYFMQ